MQTLDENGAFLTGETELAEGKNIDAEESSLSRSDLDLQPLLFPSLLFLSPSASLPILFPNQSTSTTATARASSSNNTTSSSSTTSSSRRSSPITSSSNSNSNNASLQTRTPTSRSRSRAGSKIKGSTTPPCSPSSVPPPATPGASSPRPSLLPPTEGPGKGTTGARSRALWRSALPSASP
jgi:hypothetical protein